jgi:hypothetical protein
MPEAVLVLAGLALVLCFISFARLGRQSCQHPMTGAFFLLGFAAAFPVAVAVASRACVYNGMRHVLFVVPVIACASGIAFVKAIGWLSRYGAPLRAVLVAAGLGYGIYHVSVMIRLHPYEYIYYNRIVGGPAGAFGRYETDYWGNAYSEATRRLVACMRVESGDSFETSRYTVSSCADFLSCMYFLPAQIDFTTNTSKADFLISSTRDNCHVKAPGRIILTVERMGIPLAHVIAFGKNPHR